MKENTKYGYFLYDTTCQKNYEEPFVNPTKNQKVVTIHPNQKITYSIERNIEQKVGHTPFMKDSLFHRETVLTYSNQMNKEDFCFQKMFLK